MKKKKKKNLIFEGIRKKTPPPSKKFKTDKNVLPRKKKHKQEIEEDV